METPLAGEAPACYGALTGVARGGGVDGAAVNIHTYHLLLGTARAAEAALPTALPALQVIPARRDLIGAEVELVDLPEREHRLKRALQGIAARYAYTLIDCPPSLG